MATSEIVATTTEASGSGSFATAGSHLIRRFPRFTFKTSGADVSASVLFLEKRKTALKDAAKNDGYQFHVGLIESVGWQLGDKGAKPVGLRDPSDGSYITRRTEIGSSRLTSVSSSKTFERATPTRFKWLAGGPKRGAKTGWSVPAKLVTGEKVRSLDPKRLSRKAITLREQIAAAGHFRLGDRVDFVPQGSGSWKMSKSYRYVELQDIAAGGYRWHSLRGWELPDRARHSADKGDLFVGAVWGKRAEVDARRRRYDRPHRDERVPPAANEERQGEGASLPPSRHFARRPMRLRCEPSRAALTDSQRSARTSPRSSSRRSHRRRPARSCNPS